MAKTKTNSSSHKKAIVLLFDRTREQGYLNPSHLGQDDCVSILTPSGEQNQIMHQNIKAIYFVKEFTDRFEPDRKTFLSRPKLDGLWLRLRFRDGDEMEGLVANNLLDLLEAGVRLTPPDLHGNTLWIFIPRTSLSELKVLGVVGVARRSARRDQSAATAGPDAQTKLFGE